MNIKVTLMAASIEQVLVKKTSVSLVNKANLYSNPDVMTP